MPAWRSAPLILAAMLLPAWPVLAATQKPASTPAGTVAAGPTARQDPTVDETVVTDGLALNHDALSARLEWLRAAGSVPQDVRDRAVSSYETALHNLSTAETLEHKAQAFEQARIDAPRTLTELTRELSRPAEEAELGRDVPLADLESSLRLVEADLAAARTTLEKVEGEQNKRSRRRLEAPQQIAQANAELAEIEARLRTAPPTGADEAVVAERAAQLSKQEALRASLLVYDREIASYDARRELLSAKRDQALRRIARLTERADQLSEQISAARASAAERDAKNAQAARREISLFHPVLGDLAERNADLAEMRSGDDGVATRIQAAGETLVDMRATLDHVNTRFTAAREKATAVGFTPAIGLMLRKERAELPGVTEHQRNIRLRRAEIGNVQLQMIELEEERDALADMDGAVRRVMADVEKVLAPSRLHSIENTARELLLTQRGYLDSLIEDYDRYFASLVELDAREEDLVTAIRKFARYIDENVLWIRGPSILNTRTIEGVRAAVAWGSRPLHVARLLEGVRATMSVRPVPVLFLLVLWGGLFVYRRRMRASLAALCPGRSKSIMMSTGRTIEAIALTAALASIWPLLLAIGALLLDSVEGAAGELGSSLAAGIRSVAHAFFVGEFIRRLCKAGGVVETHLGVRRARLRVIRRGVASGMAVFLPALFVVATLNQQSNDLFKTSLGRIAFMVGMTWVAVVLFRMFDPKSGLYEGRGPRAEDPWRQHLVRAVHIVAAAAPMALVVMAASGYDYAAQSIVGRYGDTLVAALVLFLGYGLVMRWLVVARRRLALRQAWERKAAQQQAEEKARTDGEAVAVPETEVLDINAVNAQTGRLVRTCMIAATVIGFWLIWHDVLPALRVFEHVELWHVVEQVTETVQSDAGPQTRVLTQQRAITILDLMMALVIGALAVIAGRNIPGFLEMTVLQRLPLDMGLRYAVTTISRYLIAVIGSVLAVNALGLGWSQVQWLVAAMTVGLGFGLQEIFANFIAGIIMLFERPVRVGDVVTLGSMSGTVARIRIRATTIIDWDRKELIIPNKEFITGQLINWTLSDQILRVVVPVGIAYGSDTQRAEHLLLQIAQENEYVLADPAPTVMFSAFGESSLDFQLRVFIAQFDHMWRVRHALCMAIDKEFRKAGVEISFPQRDLHIRSIAGPIEVAMHSEGVREHAETEPRGAGR